MKLVVGLAVATASRDFLTGWRAAHRDAPRVVYRYADVPLCEMTLSSEQSEIAQGALSQWWNGGAPVQTPISVAVDKPVTEICQARIRRRDADSLGEMIKHDFWYSYVFRFATNEVSVPLGTLNDTTPMIYAHKTFHVFGDNVQAVPSVPVPIRSDQDLRLTYDVIHYPPSSFTITGINDYLVYYNAACSMLLIGALYLLLRHELRSMRFSIDSLVRGPSRYGTLQAAACGVGTHVIATLVLFAVLTATQLLAHNTYAYSIYTLVWAFALTYPLNGYAVLESARFGNITEDRARITATALVILPATIMLIIWQTSSMMAVLGSSRAISLLPLFAKFAGLFVFVFVPLFYLGAALSCLKPPARLPAPPRALLSSDSVLEPSISSHLIPALLSLIPFGSLLLPLKLFNLANFAMDRDIFVGPFALLISLLTFVLLTAAGAIMAAFTLQKYAQADWSRVPVSMTVGICSAMIVYTLGCIMPQYWRGVATVIEFAIYNVFITGAVGAAVAAISQISLIHFSRSNDALHSGS